MRNVVLVTGGAGFIGSHVCKALAGAGFRPVVYDNMSNGHMWAVQWGLMEAGDLAAADCLDACIRRHRPESVIHLAGVIAAGESVVDPEKYFDQNVTGTLSLLSAMRRHAIDKIVFSSSAAVYGDPDDVPIMETAAIRPVNPYGRTKAMCEEILGDFARAYGTRSVSLRYFNAAGADPDGDLGEAHDPETHLLPIVLEAAAGRRAGVDIFGNRYATPDGTCVRDYIHVADLAAAHVLALKALDRTVGACAYNLGNGRGFSVKEVVAAAERVTGRKISTRMRPARAGDPAILLADSTRAVAELGWRRVFADLDVQIEHAWRWMQRQPVEMSRAYVATTAGSATK